MHCDNSQVPITLTADMNQQQQSLVRKDMQHEAYRQQSSA